MKVESIGLMLSLHGNCEKKQGIDPGNATSAALHSHYEALLGVAEVRITCFVTDKFNDRGQRTVTWNDDNDNIYLPCIDGTCPLYQHYCLGQGDKV